MPEGIPDKVEEIVAALRRENPSWDDEKVYRIAWSTYNKTKGKAVAHGEGGIGGPADGVSHGISYPKESGILLHKKQRNDNEIPLGPLSYLMEREYKEPVEEGLDPRHSVMREEVINFFIENPYPIDTQVHMHAEQLGMSHEEFEREIYALLTELINDSGLAEL